MPRPTPYSAFRHPTPAVLSLPTGLSGRQTGCPSASAGPRPARVLVVLVLVGAAWCCPTWVSAAERNASFSHALDSIRLETLQEHVDYLADDRLEGREAGSRGGLEAAKYIQQQFSATGIGPGGVDGGYTQPFAPNFRNVLGWLEGSDPDVRQQTIIVGAHYDHVGYGNRRNSRGPVGYVHNGADDNASGTAALLEIAEAFTLLAEPPRRSILFVGWDAEEKGLLGSQHWIAYPTVPLENVVFMLNMDMIGRLRDNRLTLFGVRSGYGLRQLASRCNNDLALDFSWKLVANADHWPFFENRIPVVTLHTGTHDEYHTPYDDVDLINASGMQRVARFMFVLAFELADRPEPIRLRKAATHETPELRQQLEARRPHLVDRLGARWDKNRPGAWLRAVVADSPAANAGLKPGDRVVRFAGRSIEQSADMDAAVAAAENSITAIVERKGTTEPLELELTLRGEPLRLGVTWRLDDAEPHCIILTHVVPNSPADEAGLRPGDHVYEAVGEPLTDETDFAERVAQAKDTLELLVERDGRLQLVVVRFPDGRAKLRRAA